MDYNKALLSVEVNFSTYTVRKLQEWNYPKQFMRQREDSITHKFEPKFGFKTTSQTRPLALGELQTVVTEDIGLIVDSQTISEMQTFVKNDSGKYEASAGEHDDLVMAAAIAYYSRPQQDFKVKLPQGKRVTWSPDIWEDYRNARDEAERKRIIELEGNPFC
ncbi:MAG: hypothetical protein EOM51_11965 [Clostridia bacterium]|nr:hypothetical protein [Clostridia bacterium]